MIQGSKWEIGERVTCATLQTLYSNLGSERSNEFIKGTTGLIIDECHTSGADTYFRTIENFHNSRYRFGMSGTAFDRSDDMQLLVLAAFGPMVYQIKASTLIEAGVIAAPTIHAIPVTQKGHKALKGNWLRTYRELVVESDARNGAILAAMKHAHELGRMPGIVFVRQVEHARDIARRAEKLGFNVVWVDGTKNLSQRKNAIEALNTSKIDFIVSTKVFVEGINAPEIRSVINGAGGKSVSETLQQVGRGTRKPEGKMTCDVYDIADTGFWTLQNHYNQRVEAYLREGYEVLVDPSIWPDG
jgi:superfamily II DNA or RNA helicase